jgi:hypothetical protein
LKLFLEQEVFEFVAKPTEDQERNALKIHCFPMEKRDGRIKARAVADGRSQIRYTEEETYSPTVNLRVLCYAV